MSKPCRYVEGYGHYLRAHELNCRDRECDGCQPCTHDEHGNPVKHCTARATCGNHLDASHPLTCPKCIGRVRADLAAIVAGDAEIIDEALLAGVESEAANLAGPVADPEAWTWHKVAQAKAGAAWEAIEEDDDGHPLFVLGTWDFMLREDYDQPTTARATVPTCAAYLDEMLTRLAQDPEQDWPLFAREIRACRTKLENVLHTSKRPKRGAPCPACAAEPPLVKVYFAHDHKPDHDFDGPCLGCDVGDEWRCPSCKNSWSELDYRRWVANDYLDNAVALTATEIQMIYGVKPGTLRRWANGWTTEAGDERPAIVHKRGHDGSGRQLYDVEDVRTALHDTSDKTAEDVA